MSDLIQQIAQLNAQIKDLTTRFDIADRVNFIDVVNLSTAQPVLIGRYRANAEHIVVTLDATNGAFTIQWPSAKEVRDKIFIIKKIDEVSTPVTFSAKSGEYIHDSGAKTSTLSITTTAPMNMVSDRVDTWLVAG